MQRRVGRRRRGALISCLGAFVGASALAAVGACFTGMETVGAWCATQADCGDEQSCVNSVCSICGNGNVDAGEFCYGAADETPVGGEVVFLVDGDFDDDGDIDLMGVGNTVCGGAISGPCWSFSILVNEGAGNFEVVRNDPVPGTIESAVIGNYNGNDEVDAAFTLANTPVVVVALDLFSDPVPFTLELPGDARTVRHADIDRDGDLDLLVAADPPLGVLDASIFSFANDGQGNFATFEPIVAPGSAWLAPAVDLDGDGNDDLVATHLDSNRLSVLHGDGAGGFTNAQELETRSGPRFATLALVDGDDRLDLVVANTGDSSVSVFRGRDDGSFADGERLETGPNPSFIGPADLNQDGEVDLAVANMGDDKLSIYLGRDGEFPDAIEFDVGTSPNWIVHRDFDGDGQPDLAVAAGDDIAFSYGDF